MGYIDLPQPIKSEKAVINVQNKDNRCFEYAILSALHHDEIKDSHGRPSKHKKYWGKLSFTGNDFPVSPKDIGKFGKQNPGKGVSVYGYEKSVQILRMNRTDPQNAIDLLFITNEENQHYCWVKDLSRLVSSQVPKSGRKYYFCKSSYRKFLSPEKLKNHLLECKSLRNLRI